MLIHADARDKILADGSVHMVVTSPPYWGLRDYGKEGQLGLEPTPGEYIDNLMRVMDNVWDALRPDGTCWVVIGDTHHGSGKGAWSVRGPQKEAYVPAPGSKAARVGRGVGKSKSLALIPFRFALAVQERGWIVRQDVIWHKPNAMPSSVKDRPSTDYEHIFLLVKQGRYYYDALAISEKSVGKGGGGFSRKYAEAQPGHGAMRLQRGDYSAGRNARSVWSIPTQPFRGGHFATFPEALVRRVILAGTSERGACKECGKQWRRDVKTSSNYTRRERAHAPNSAPTKVDSTGWQPPTITDGGFVPACDCGAPVVPSIVFDPFIGSGTTVKVAEELGRRAIGIELNSEYLKLARQRTAQAPLGM